MSVKYLKWIKQKVLFVYDLLNAKSQFLTFTNFTTQYKIRSNYFKYNSVIIVIKRAIQEMKINITEYTVILPFIPFYFNIILKHMQRICTTKTGKLFMLYLFIAQKFEIAMFIISNKNWEFSN